MENYEVDVHNEQEKTSRDAKVYHDKYFYFDFEGKEYRGLWYTVGFSYAGLRVWKKTRKMFWFVERNCWQCVIEDVLKFGERNLVQEKRDYYNAIKTYDECTYALSTTSEHMPHTLKIVR